ncbi:cell division protein FtsW [Rothia nasimurium]|uniref:Probable peptidoglycan glycosyltransferase FtsW n=1 Tax=Rothia nasimurium TaxID=85336 RepID=A0A4Y9F5P9_9MICC|nr:putative peptidoglycan glycosyltransferase FtsW [Rothia nasimurium]MBF0807447.1 FtsW/RodA/SpoVE family cell cycle protein [Rothia nasimurium]TFU23744.1 cell division protein FtsW [Rothia nasimurium]
MRLATETRSPQRPGLIRRAWGRARSTWENAQVRLGSMVLTDVPIVLVVTATVLTLFGVMMVLSASSVEQISSGAGAFSQARSQGMFAVLGLVAMLLVGYLVPVIWYRRPWAVHTLLGAAALLLIAVIFVGSTVNGNRNWINIAGFSIQPSEFAKPIMILWLASVYSRQGRIDRGTLAQTAYKGLIPALLGFGLIITLILAGHDVGTVLIYALFFSAIFLAARPSRGLVMISAGLGTLAAIMMVAISPNRIERLFNTFAFWRDCVEATCDQANSGLAALATGGFWGVGLGQSRQKYNYLPEAHNDYIFAVVGEELGLIGAIAVLLLYAALIYCAMRILLRSSDLFIRYATIGIITWIVGQALLNIAMVVGLMPVIGVPLPFISAGGSALVSSLTGIGILIAFARQTPLNPIVGERTGIANSKMQKDAARRLALARIAEREQAVIAADPDGTGWTLDKLTTRLGALVDGRTPARPAASAPQRTQGSARTVRPSAATARPSAQTVRRSSPLSAEASAEAAMARRSSSASGARPSASVQQAHTRTTAAQPQHPARPAAPTTAVKLLAAASRATAHQPAGPQTTELQAPAPKEQKLPAGLRTIRKARKLPEEH